MTTKEKEDIQKLAETMLREEQKRCKITSIEDAYKKGYEKGYIRGKTEPLNVSARDMAWELSREYLLDQTRAHHLSWYFEMAIRNQKKLDKEKYHKLLDIWLEKAVDMCIKICETAQEMGPDDELQIDLEKLREDIIGIEL